MNKNILAIAFIFTLFIQVGCSSQAEDKVIHKKSEHVESSTAGSQKLVVFAGKKEGEAMIEGLKEIQPWANQVKKAANYEEEDDYKQAEIEYLKAIELSPDKADQGVARSGLIRIYEATGKYKLAIEQIDWLLAQGLRKDVTDKLLAQKQNLEKLLADQTRSNP